MHKSMSPQPEGVGHNNAFSVDHSDELHGLNFQDQS